MKRPNGVAFRLEDTAKRTRRTASPPSHDHGDQLDGVSPGNDCSADRAGELYQYMNIIIEWSKS